MIIQKMTAHFGNLHGETLELREGMNVLCLPNESGKSTWCAFLRAMLYGVDSAQRERGGVKPDKLRFAPWSGEAMSGEMEIEYEGRNVTLLRRTKSASAPMRDFAAVYTGTAESVEGLTGADAGETLTGVPKAVFEDSAFIAQAGLGVSGSAELEKRIAALVSTGEENQSYSQAEETLRAWQRKRRYKRSGALPALEEEIAVRERQLAELAAAARERETLEARLSAARERAAEAEARLEAEREQQSQRLLLELTLRREERRAAEEAEREAQERLERAREALAASPFAGKNAQEAEKAAGEDAELLSALKAAVKKPWSALVFALLAVILGVVSALAWRPGLLIAFACLVAALIWFLVYNGHKKEYGNMSEALRRRYGTAESGGIEALYGDYRALLAEEAGAASDFKERAAASARALEAQRQAESALLAGPQTQRQAAALRDAELEARRVKEALDRLNGRFSALGDPMVLQTELGDLRARREALEGQYAALELSLRVLGEANAEMQQRFSPELGRRASAYMEALTGGRYDRLLFDRQFRARARLSGAGEDHELAFLSAGAADQLYLALRLAICDMVLPPERGCPLILDDALANFDDERMARTMELLGRVAEQRQVILFTCHSREAAYWEKTHGSVDKSPSDALQ